MIPRRFTLTPLLTPLLTLSLILTFTFPLLISCASRSPRPRLWVDLYTGEPAPFSEVLSDLSGARVIYLGEIHTLERHAEGQLRILRGLTTQGRPVALALEQMEFFNQAELDRYARGEIDFDQLARATRWSERWSNYERYRPLLEAARQAGAPLVALNARSETIREVGRQGLAGLAPQARGELPADIHLDDPLYEKLMNMKLMVHMSVDEKRLRKVYEAQVARDENMARSLADFLSGERGRGRIAVVICGGGHVSYGLGLPDRVRRRIPGIEDRIVLFSESGELELTEAERKMARPTGVTHQTLRFINRPLADYAQVAPYSAGLSIIPD